MDSTGDQHGNTSMQKVVTIFDSYGFHLVYAQNDVYAFDRKGDNISVPSEIPMNGARIVNLETCKSFLDELMGSKSYLPPSDDFFARIT